MTIKFYALWLSLIGFAGCSAAIQESDTFLSQINLKEGVYAWAPGSGSSAENWKVSSIAVQNGGKTILVYTTHTPSVRLILNYDSPMSSNQAYYRNTVEYTSGGNTYRGLRHVGIRIANGRLIWAGYSATPSLTDWQNISSQTDFDTFCSTYWGRDKISFTREYAVLGL